MKMLICIGGMPYGRPTVRFGGLVAGATDSSVTIMMVISSDDQREGAEKSLQQAEAMFPGLGIESKVRLGSPASEILRESQEGDYDVVVVGTRDVLSLAELFMGSIARRSVRRIRASVLVVRRGCPDLDRMLVCTAGQDEEDPVVKMGARVAQAAQAHVTLLHVTGTVPGMYKGLDAMGQRSAKLLDTGTPLAQHLRHGLEVLENHGVAAQLKLRQGAVASQILFEAHEGEYDLVVVGASKFKWQARGLFMVDVTRQVVDKALRPVLVVR